MNPSIRSACIALVLVLAACDGAAPVPPGDGAATPGPVPPVAANPGRCDMREAFIAPDANRPAGRAPVWGPSSNPAAGPAFYGARLNVNTDGTRRSYSVDDPGATSFALNRICNAMTNYCRELDPAGRQRRFQALRAARDADWPAAALAATRLRPNIIPRRPDGRVCPEMTIDGHRFLVSSTALFNPAVRDQCSIDRYVDALTVPALVLPGRMDGPTGFERRGMRVGDVVVAWRPGLAQPVFAVAGDTGPADKLGEGSVAMNGALLRRTQVPQTYDDLLRDFVVPRAHVLVFPGTRDSARPLITVDRIEQVARSAFAAWGGGSEAQARQRLADCAAAYDTAAP